MNNYVNEPKIDEVLYQLYQRNGYKDILKDIEKFKCFLYFMEENQIPSMVDKAKNIEGEEFENLIQNLMQLYPFSKIFISEFMQSIQHSLEDKNTLIVDNILKSYQIMDRQIETKRDILERTITGVASTDKINKFKRAIDEYEKKKDENKNKLQELIKMGTSEKELLKEVKELEDEIIQLEKSYTKEALQNQKKELIKKQFQLRENEDEYKKQQEYINKLQDELSNNNLTTVNYKQVMSALSLFAKDLKKGEE